MATPAKTFWEDIEIGRVLETGSMKMEATDIRSFAKKFDPQTYHLIARLEKPRCSAGYAQAAGMSQR
jgi:hypothetical protein